MHGLLTGQEARDDARPSASTLLRELNDPAAELFQAV
jgi:hypothetical protein